MKTNTIITMVAGSQSPSNSQSYRPSDAKVNPGSNIMYTNEDTAIHTATSGQDVTPDGLFDTGLVSQGQSSQAIYDADTTSLMFTKWRYHISVLSIRGMEGIVTVSSSESGPTMNISNNAVETVENLSRNL